MARLDRLAAAKTVAQYAAVIGRRFSYALLYAVSQVEEATLRQELGRLVEAELLYQRGLPPQATYTFKHALIRDAAYQSLLRSTRQDYHQRIAQVLAMQFPEVVETRPELLAHHYTEAGQHEAAISYWQRAGQRALQRWAYVEAIAHLRQGLALLTTLPETPARRQQELDLQVALGPALVATKGNAVPDAERAYARARELCQEIGNTPQLFPVLRGLLLYYQARGQTQTAYRLGEQLLSLAQSQPEPAPLLLAHFMLGMVLFLRGESAAAHTHHTQALAVYNPQEHRTLALRYGLDLGVDARSYLAWELWQLGYPDQAIHHSQAALTLAQEVSHPQPGLCSGLDGHLASASPRGVGCARAGRGSDDPGNRAGVCVLVGPGNGPARLGTCHAGTGRAGHCRDAPGSHRRPGHGGQGDAAVLPGPAG